MFRTWFVTTPEGGLYGSQLCVDKRSKKVVARYRPWSCGPTSPDGADLYVSSELANESLRTQVHDAFNEGDRSARKREE